MSISLNLSIAYFLPRLFHVKFTSFQPSGDRKINENHIFPNSLYYVMTAEISSVDNENSTIRLLFCQIEKAFHSINRFHTILYWKCLLREKTKCMKYDNWCVCFIVRDRTSCRTHSHTPRVILLSSFRTLCNSPSYSNVFFRQQSLQLCFS